MKATGHLVLVYTELARQMVTISFVRHIQHTVFPC